VLVDTHCHLDAPEFDADRGAVIARALAAGVGRIVVPAVEACGFDALRALARDQACVRYALGIHPLFVDRARDEDLDVLRGAAESALGDPAFVGIGEIGLDHFVPGSDRARQERFLVAQLRIARDLGLPVILHVRRAQDPLLKQLRRVRPSGGIAHAFNGSAQQAAAFVELGFALGFGGAMTFERALRIRHLASTIPMEACVLETDAPDIAPAWLRAARNEPAELPAIAAAFAALRGIPTARAIEVTAANSARVLPRLAAAHALRPPI
jgi:TatD DNase family protein